MPNIPYIQQLPSKKSLDIWIVDGSIIRTTIDEEFTNFGHHFRYPFIPENELWFDQEAHPDEYDFFLCHALVEYEEMKKGMPYEQALDLANHAERQARKLAGDMKNAVSKTNPLPDLKLPHVRLWKKLKNGVCVWLVDGRKVRSIFDVDFTAGGHDYVYEFVPENEVWIDDDISEAERPYTLVHELHERNRMAEGYIYDDAHAEASELESYYRKHPDELHERLFQEGWA